jgi:hypothetical protein
MSVPVQTPAFDDTWAQWDESHPRESKDSSHHAHPDDTQVALTETPEMFHELNPWESQVELGSGGRQPYQDGTTIGMVLVIHRLCIGSDN